MIWQQVRDATRKPFGRNNIYIDHGKKLKGFSFQIPVNYLNDINLYNSQMDGIDLMESPFAEVTITT